MKVSTLLGKVILVSSLLFTAGWLQAAPVNVNKADVKALVENISGIGPKKAQAIVKYRESNGPFKSAEDLIKVKGIGQKIIDRNKGDIHFSDASAKTAMKTSTKN